MFFDSRLSVKKEPAASYSRAGESRTTLGDGALDFRVRDGNGYDSPSVATGEDAVELAAEGNRSALEARDPLLMKLEE